MKRELQDYVWTCLPKEFKEEVKKEYEHQLSIDNEQAYWMLERIFSRYNLTSDAEGEEMLCVKASIVREMYALNEDILYSDPTHKGAILLKKKLTALFGSKCLPDETNLSESLTGSEPKPAEPKFKVGDKVRIVKDITHENEHKGDVTEIIYVDRSDPDATYKVDIFDERFGGGLWYSESDLEPYTEPTDLDKESSTCTNDCPSQCPSQNFDNIVNRGFRDHNRLHIAAQIVAALYANYQAAKDFKSIEELVRKALDITDTLIKESEKGGEA